MNQKHTPPLHSQADHLAKACNRIHASLEIPAIMRAAVTSTLELIEAEIAAAGLLIDGEMAFSECFDGANWTHLKHRFRAGDGVIGHVIRHGRSFLSHDSNQEPQINPEIEMEIGKVRQFIAVPILGQQDGLIGCLLLLNKKVGDFSEDELTRVEQLTSITSIAINNAIHLSERQRIEEDLQKSVATYRTLVEQIPAITYIATLDRSRILFVSPQVETLLGHSPGDFLSEPDMWKKQIHEEDRERVLAEFRHSYSVGAPFHSEYRITRHDGEVVCFKDAADVVRDNEQALYLQGVMYDITERKQFEEKLAQMAYFDPLTGLANRSLFDDRLSQSVAHAKRHKQRFAILYLDLDGFKAVNDTMGHKVGDEVLAETARRLQQCVREVDTVARMGGDEFTIILNGINSDDDISLVAAKLLKAIGAPYEKAGAQNEISASIGIAIYPDHTSNTDALITAADNAMYLAKNAGKNRYYFSGE